MRVGSAKYALALAKHRQGSDDPVGSEDAPEGFEFLGAGCSRDAFLGPDGVVYKYGSTYANECEADNYKYILPNMPDGWTLAPSTYYACGVLAMECVRGMIDNEYHNDDEECICSGRCIQDTISELTRATGLYDIHDENYFVRPDGVRVLIDYAY